MSIVISLREKPSNTNQVAKKLGVDYKSIQYQLDVLSKNGLVETPDKESYGAMYFLSPLMERNLDYVREIWKSKMNKKKGSRE